MWHITPSLSRQHKRDYWSDADNFLWWSTPRSFDIPVTNTFDVGRYYFDRASGIGCRFWANHPINGHPSSVVELQRAAHGQWTSALVPLLYEWDPEWLEMDTDNLHERGYLLLNMSPAEFEQKMQHTLHAPHEVLSHLATFYRQSEEARCLNALNCTSLVRCLAQKKFEFEFLQAMQQGGELAGYELVAWRPWVNWKLRAYTSLSPSRHVFVPIPAGLQARCAAIRAQLGCRDLWPAPTCHVPKAQYVRAQWASQFRCKVQRDDGHTFFAKAVDLQRDIEALEAQLAQA